jgi:hypothetical protein
LLDQKSQVDTEPLGSLDTAPCSRIRQSFFRSRQLFGCQGTQFPHVLHGSAYPAALTSNIATFGSSVT